MIKFVCNLQEYTIKFKYEYTSKTINGKKVKKPRRTICRITKGDNLTEWTGTSVCIDDFAVNTNIHQLKYMHEKYNVIRSYKVDDITRLLIIRGDNFNYATGRLLAIKNTLMHIPSRIVRTTIMEHYTKYEMLKKFRKEKKRLTKRLAKINEYLPLNEQEPF